MNPIEKKLGDVVAEAIGRQLDTPVQADREADERAQRLTADQLVRDALAGGQFGSVNVSAMRSFSGGNTAMLVARLDTTMSFVVKVDRSPSLISEAHHLQQAAADPALPEATRRAFPKIYAVDDVGPIYGYLMENLEGYTTIAETLTSGDPDLTRRVLHKAWSAVLAPAYRATRRSRIVPNVAEDYFVRAEQRLQRAATLGLLPPRDQHLRIERHDAATEVPHGWGALIDTAHERLEAVVPPFSTFVHGDPNPENILWSGGPDATINIRLIDPKDWRTGDYLFDVAKIGHYLRVTSPVEHQGIEVGNSTSREGTTISYDPAFLATNEGLERELLSSVAHLAEDVEEADCASWRDRYELAVAANLLGIVGPRLERAAANGSKSDAALSWVAFAEGLRILSV